METFEKWEDDVAITNVLEETVIDLTKDDDMDSFFSTTMGTEELSSLREYVAEKFIRDRQIEAEEKKHPLPRPTHEQMQAMTHQEREEYRHAYMKNYVPPPGKKLVMFTTTFASTSFPDPILEDMGEVQRQCLSGERKSKLKEEHLTWKYAPMLQRHYDLCPCQVCQTISLKLKTLMAKRLYIEEFYSRDSLIEFVVKTNKPRPDTC